MTTFTACYAFSSHCDFLHVWRMRRVSRRRLVELGLINPGIVRRLVAAFRGGR